jgi:hypothetical protein
MSDTTQVVIKNMEMPSRGGLLLRAGLSLVAAVVLLVCFVLPAELHVDLTGIGTVTGLMELSNPTPVIAPASAGLASAPPTAGMAARAYGLPFRSDEIKIPLKVDEELEYKVRMQAGGTLVYSWQTDMGTVYYDFHGDPNDPTKSESYAADVGSKYNGSLIAPFTGIHGWFLQNQEAEPVVVTIHMSGFYELLEKQP